MKSPSSGKKSRGYPKGPALTRAEKVRRDRKEAARERREGARDRKEAQRAREEAASAREKAIYHETMAAHYASQDDPLEAAEQKSEAASEMLSRRHDLARAERDRARAGRRDARAKREEVKAERAAAGLASAGKPGSWILGGNGQLDSCMPAALANHLLLTAGVRLADDDVAAWYWRAAGGADGGASLSAALRTADQPFCAKGVMPSAPVDHSRSGLRATGAADRGPLILLLDLQGAQRDQSVWDAEPSPPWGTHAALYADGHVVCWGRETEVTQAFLEAQVAAAWSVEWTEGSM